MVFGSTVTFRFTLDIISFAILPFSFDLSFVVIIFVAVVAVAVVAVVVPFDFCLSNIYGTHFGPR